MGEHFDFLHHQQWAARGIPCYQIQSRWLVSPSSTWLIEGDMVCHLQRCKTAVRSFVNSRRGHPEQDKRTGGRSPYTRLATRNTRNRSQLEQSIYSLIRFTANSNFCLFYFLIRFYFLNFAHVFFQKCSALPVLL